MLKKIKEFFIKGVEYVKKNILWIVIIILGIVVIFAIFDKIGTSIRVNDLGTTIEKLSDENKRFEQLIKNFEGERSKIYRQFETAISGATGDIRDALATIQRIKKKVKQLGD